MFALAAAVRNVTYDAGETLSQSNPVGSMRGIDLTFGTQHETPLSAAF
jgi:hypothetical protein